MLAGAASHAEKGQWSVSLTPGFAAPVGSFARQNGNSLNVLAGLNYEVQDGYWYGLELGYSGGHRRQGRLDGEDFDKDGSDDAVAFTSNMDTMMLHVNPVLKAGGEYTDDLRYCFIVGPGLYSFFRDAGSIILEGATTNQTSVAGRTVPVGKAANTFFGLDLGHTLGYEVSSAFEVGLDVRYHLVFMPGGPSGVVVPGFRFAFLF